MPIRGRRRWRIVPMTAGRTGRARRPRSRNKKRITTSRRREKRSSPRTWPRHSACPGLDDESNRAFAAKLMKYAGWRSVAYRGHGVFDVDYHFDGRATQDFLFPALPDNDLIIPFIAHPAPRRWLGAGHRASVHRRGGTVGVPGPVTPRPADEGTARFPRRGTVHRHHRRRNSDQQQRGWPAADPIGHQLHWDVGAASNKIPET